MSQELVFFPKEKLTDAELIKLNKALKAPGLSDKALRSVSIPVANLAAWLWAVLHYGMAQRRGLPTGLLLRQVEAALAREQARLGQLQFQIDDLLEEILSLTKKLEEAQASHNLAMETLNQAQGGQFHKWPIRSLLLTPIHTWTEQLQVTSPSQMSLPFHFTSHHMPCFLFVFTPSSPYFSLHIPCCPRITFRLPFHMPPYLTDCSCLGYLSTPEVEESLQDCVWRCPLVLSCHCLSGSLPTTAAPRTVGKVAVSVSGL